MPILTIDDELAEPVTNPSRIQIPDIGSDRDRLVQPISPTLISPADTLLKLPDPNNNRGILQTIWHEGIVVPVVGTARTAAAAIMTPIDMAGITMPLTFEDLTKQDLRGAVFGAAMILSGGVGTAVRLGGPPGPRCGGDRPRPGSGCPV